MPASRLLALPVLLILAVTPALALEADQIALIVNRNVPAGQKLAEFYARQRQLPPGRIIALNLPTGDDLPYERYETDVVVPVRQFLRDNGLEEKVTCLVTFFGVPLRIGNRPVGKAEQPELDQLRQSLERLKTSLDQVVVASEQLGQKLNPGFHPTTQGIDPGVRAEAALRTIAAAIAALPEEQRRDPMQQWASLVQQMGGLAALSQQFGAAELGNPNVAAEERTKWQQMVQRVQAASQELPALQQDLSRPANRLRLRQLAGELFGLFGQLRLLQQQIDFLAATETGAALDSELSLLWQEDYPRGRWLHNALHYAARSASNPSTAPRLPLMVMRLDAPQPGQVQQMIQLSLQVEQKGLKGKIVIDSRGIPARDSQGRPNGYGTYDQSLRDLAELVKAKTHLTLVFDGKPELLPPNSVKDVALYCGWYSLRHYVPCCAFVPGAVAFHVASAELVSLHNEQETGWARGLLNDGAVATLGPVAEPYLHAFPPADDFFPLLMTGRLTLAEVYWRTVPVSSWMVSCIGDPLYRPFQADPPLKAEDLPDRLRPLLAEEKATR